MLPQVKFELEFRAYDAQAWFAANAIKWTTGAVCFYLLTIFGLKKWMESREAFRLKGALVCWNGLLAMFSMAGALRCGTKFLSLYSEGGFKRTICTHEYYYENPTAFWIMAYTLSKLPELVDTYFIVLRKRPLIFLHWYHHASVLAYCWLSYQYFYASAIWYTTMNYTIHTFMYTYYAAMALNIRSLRKYAHFLTAAQILQMVMGGLTQVVLHLYRDEPSCPSSPEYIIAGVTIAVSYGALFTRLYYNAYLKKSKKTE